MQLPMKHSLLDSSLWVLCLLSLRKANNNHTYNIEKGGSIIYNQSVLDAVNNATAIFDLTNEDPKAQAIISYLFAVNEV